MNCFLILISLRCSPEAFMLLEHNARVYANIIQNHASRYVMQLKLRTSWEILPTLGNAKNALCPSTPIQPLRRPPDPQGST